MRFDTRLVQGGATTNPAGDVVAPLHLSTTFDRSGQDEPRYFYARGENPTREELERCLAGLEDAACCSVYASGQAAATTVLSLLDPGLRVVACDDVYGGTHALLAGLARYGVEVAHVDLSDPVLARRAFTGPDAERIGMVWIESPTNPLLKIVDIAGVAAAARAVGALVVVDNTLASPVLQQPLALGADLSVYSTTKSVAGHLDVLGGAVVCRDEALHRCLVQHRTVAGNVPGSIDAYLVLRGLRTLALRVRRQVATARVLARLLQAHPAVTAVHFPGLPGDPGFELARRQMRGPGSVISFRYAGDPVALMDRLRLFAAAVSLGGVRSLVEVPALMTHRPVPPATRRRLGVTEDLVRLSVGIEDPEDLAEDLAAALTAGPGCAARGPVAAVPA